MKIPRGLEKQSAWRWLTLCWRIYWRGRVTAYSVGGSDSERVTVRITNYK